MKFGSSNGELELRRMLDIVEEEKRHMRFQMQQVLDEKVVESSTTAPTRETSKMKPVCDHGSNSGFGENMKIDACQFSKHLQETHHMPEDKSGWLESSSSWPSS